MINEEIALSNFDVQHKLQFHTIDQPATSLDPSAAEKKTIVRICNRTTLHAVYAAYIIQAVILFIHLIAINCIYTCRK